MGQATSPLQGTLLGDWLEIFSPKPSLQHQFFEAVIRTYSPYEFNPFNLHPLRAALTNVVNFDELQRSTSTTLRLCATNVRTGKPRVFTNAEVTVDVVLASACLPMLFQAVEIEGEHYTGTEDISATRPFTR